MDTHAPKPADMAATLSEVPPNMYFGAKDYAPHAKKRSRPTEVQGKVTRARTALLTDLHRTNERLTVALRHVRVADDYGLAPASIDVLLATAEDLLSHAKRLAKSADNAEQRYFDALAEPAPPEQPTSSNVGMGALVYTGSGHLVGKVSQEIEAETERRIGLAHAALDGRLPGTAVSN